MEPVTIPAAVLAFLIGLGCNPTREVYFVDEIAGVEWAKGREVGGIYCPIVKEPYCPIANAVFIRKDAYRHSLLVHELWHSCQPQAPFGTPQWRMNEMQARNIEEYWERKR